MYSGGVRRRKERRRWGRMGRDGISVLVREGEGRFQESKGFHRGYRARCNRGRVTWRSGEECPSFSVGNAVVLRDCDGHLQESRGLTRRILANQISATGHSLRNTRHICCRQPVESAVSSGFASALLQYHHHTSFPSFLIPPISGR